MLTSMMLVAAVIHQVIFSLHGLAIAGIPRAHPDDRDKNCNKLHGRLLVALLRNTNSGFPWDWDQLQLIRAL